MSRLPRHDRRRPVPRQSPHVDKDVDNLVVILVVPKSEFDATLWLDDLWVGKVPKGTQTVSVNETRSSSESGLAASGTRPDRS